MKYTQPRFTLPAGSSKITQEQWDRAFGKTITLSSYADYFSSWYGLKDGTHLAVTDPRGKMWAKVGKDDVREWEIRVEASRDSPKCNDTSDLITRRSVSK